MFLRTFAVALAALAYIAGCAREVASRPGGSDGQRPAVSADSDLAAYFTDASTFHGNGDRIFASGAGVVVVERFSGAGAGGGVEVRRHRAAAPAVLTSELEAAIAAVSDPELAVTDRLGVPDEVRTRLQVRDRAARRWDFAVWDRAWAQQPEVLQQVRGVMLKLRDVAVSTAPFEVATVTASDAMAYWPSDVPQFAGATTHRISKELALAIARQASDGFLGTWVTVSRVAGNWHIRARSKSANPPVLLVVDGKTGGVLYRSRNTDVESVPDAYRSPPADEVYEVEDAHGTPRWLRADPGTEPSAR